MVIINDNWKSSVEKEETWDPIYHGSKCMQIGEVPLWGCKGGLGFYYQGSSGEMKKQDELEEARRPVRFPASLSEVVERRAWSSVT